MTKDMQIALRVLSVLRKSPVVLKSSDMVEYAGTTTFFLDQVLRKLKNYGLIESKRGPGGGYFIVSDRINALEVAKSLDHAPEVIGLPDSIEFELTNSLKTIYESVVF